MKKKWIVATALLTLAFILAACGNEEPVSSETSAPAETTVVTEPPETTLPPTEPPTTVPETTAPPATEPEETLPEGAVALSQEELDALTELFTQPQRDVYEEYFPYTNWYNMAMASHYETPEQMDVRVFFSEGVGGPENFNYQPSDAEKAFLESYPQVPLKLSVYRVPRETMNTVLQQYFGLTLAEMDGVGMDQMAYNPATDCYYSAKGGITYIFDFEITGGYRTADGNVSVNYSLYSMLDCTMTLKPVDGGYQILSNIYHNR